MLMCLIHKWGQWEQYEVENPARRLTKRWGLLATIGQRQRKKCCKCGKVKDELIYIKVIN